MTLTVDLIPHLDAGDRTIWTGDQDQRPLSELGRRQALAIADALGEAPFVSLYSSPALRCRQSLEPLAERLGLLILDIADLREIPNQHRAALATRAAQALGQISTISLDGSVAVCGHGDLSPALAEYLAGLHGLAPPAPLTERGQWYELTLNRDAVTAITLRPAPPRFPR